MSALPKAPLRDAAPVRIDDMGVQRLWRGIVARRAERRASASGTLALRWVGMGALAGALLTTSFYWVRPRIEPAEGPTPSALMLSDGKPLAAVAAPATGARTVTFSDGSLVQLSPEARLEPLASDPTSVSLLLARGDATFDVRPGGPRRWNVECGLATVEVVGTRFTIMRSPERLVVNVSRGVVLVRGERVPDRVRRLEAGEGIEVLGAGPASRPEAAPSAVTGNDAPAAAASTGSGAGWRELSRRGEYAHAYRLLGRGGIGLESAGSSRIDDLMALADVARLSGHPADAVEPLSRVVREFAPDPRASLAAFTLGKIRLSEPGGAAAAARDFQTALGLGLPASLGEDAYTNVVEAFRRAGDDGAAREAAIEYARRFPASARAAALRGWATGQ
jgi:transmembrane sensor